MKDKIQNKFENILSEYIPVGTDESIVELKVILEELAKIYPNLASDIEDVIYKFAEEFVASSEIDDVYDRMKDEEVTKDANTN